MHTSFRVTCVVGVFYKVGVGPSICICLFECILADPLFMERMLFVKNYLLEEVSKKLAEVFGDMSIAINADETYLNSVVVNDEGKQMVDYSESLSWAIMEKVQENELPAFNDEYAGIFFKRWTFDKNDRVTELDIADLNKAGRVVVESYRNK